MTGVQGRAVGRLPVQCVLRPLPQLSPATDAVDATNPYAGPTVIHRLRWQDRRRDRWRSRRNPYRPGLRGRAGRVELHLNRGDLEPATAGLNWQPRTRARIRRWLARSCECPTTCAASCRRPLLNGSGPRREGGSAGNSSTVAEENVEVAFC